MLPLGGVGDPGIGELTATLVAKIDIGNTESPPAPTSLSKKKMGETKEVTNRRLTRFPSGIRSSDPAPAVGVIKILQKICGSNLGRPLTLILVDSTEHSEDENDGGQWRSCSGSRGLLSVGDRGHLIESRVGAF